MRFKQLFGGFAIKLSWDFLLIQTSSKIQRSKKPEIHRALKLVLKRNSVDPEGLEPSTP